MHDRKGASRSEVADASRSVAYGWMLGGLIGVTSYLGLTAIGIALYVTGNVPLWAARVTGWIIVCTTVGLSLVVVLAFGPKGRDQTETDRSRAPVRDARRSRDPRGARAQARA